MTGAAAQVGDGVPDRVDLQVTHVRLAARVGEHFEHVVVVALGLVGNLPRALALPQRLPPPLDLARVVALGHFCGSPREARKAR
jgi:hypothetical protein